MTAHATLSEFRANIARFLDQVEADRAELVVTRQDHEPYVVMPLKELEALHETLYVLSSRANTGWLAGSLAELDAGKGKERNLIEP